MSVDFSRYLDVPVDSIEKPKCPPNGHYFATITGTKTREIDYKQGDAPVPVVTISFKTTAPDVDVEGLTNGEGVGVLMERDYALNDADGSGLYRLRQLGEVACALPTKGLSLSDMLPMLVGQPVKLYNEPRQDKKDPERFYPTVKGVFPAA